MLTSVNERTTYRYAFNVAEAIKLEALNVVRCT